MSFCAQLLEVDFEVLKPSRVVTPEQWAAFEGGHSFYLFGPLLAWSPKFEKDLLDDGTMGLRLTSLAVEEEGESAPVWDFDELAALLASELLELTGEPLTGSFLFVGEELSYFARYSFTAGRVTKHEGELSFSGEGELL